MPKYQPITDTPPRDLIWALAQLHHHPVTRTTWPPGHHLTLNPDTGLVTLHTPTTNLPWTSTTKDAEANDWAIHA